MKTIELTRGLVAIVDDDDFDRLAQYHWQANKAGYANRTRFDPVLKKRVQVFMHHEVLRRVNGKDTDHKNGNKADNRKENLRICTRSENVKNTPMRRDNKTGMKGVTFNRGRFQARIYDRIGNRVNLGRFHTAEEAKAAYDKAAIELHGEFAKLN